MDDLPPFAPESSAEEREEIGRIDYLLDEIRHLRDRGLIPPEAVEAVRSEKGARRSEIERRSLARGALRAAHGLAHKSPRAALSLAERGREPSTRARPGPGSCRRPCSAGSASSTAPSPLAGRPPTATGTRRWPSGSRA